jgi:hypothetical protein
MFPEGASFGLRVRLALLWLLAACITLGGIRTGYLTILAADLPALHEAFALYPDRATPEYPQFLTAVAAATPPGSKIAIFVPMRRWDDGYSYAYYRASYILAGREVLPIVWNDDRLLSANVARADYIAVWRSERVHFPGYATVLRAAGGRLLKVTR